MQRPDYDPKPKPRPRGSSKTDANQRAWVSRENREPEGWTKTSGHCNHASDVRRLSARCEHLSSETARIDVSLFDFVAAGSIEKPAWQMQ
jgi:hypothetical protein